MEKELATRDFLEMIRKSWTWARLTDQEKERFVDVVYDCDVKGSYKQRFHILHKLYHAFLMGMNYDPLNWREENDPLF